MTWNSGLEREMVLSYSAMIGVCTHNMIDPLNGSSKNSKITQIFVVLLYTAAAALIYPGLFLTLVGLCDVTYQYS